jgi:hypothetical protein
MAALEPVCESGVLLMRGFAVVLGYLVGLAAIVSIGIVGVMALQSPIKPMPTAPIAASAPQKEPVAKPVKQTTQKDAQSNQKRKTVRATRKRIETSGFNAYGYANEPRRFYQYPSPFFSGRY